MRLLRLEKELKHLVSSILLKDIRNPKIGFISITKVDISPDLAHAKVYYSHFGNKEEAKKTHFALKSASYYITGKIGKVMKTKQIPKLRFLYDSGLEKLAEISRVIQSVNK